MNPDDINNVLVNDLPDSCSCAPVYYPECATSCLCRCHLLRGLMSRETDTCPPLNAREIYWLENFFGGPREVSHEPEDDTWCVNRDSSGTHGSARMIRNTFFNDEAYNLFCIRLDFAGRAALL